jgi:hypothetical protein
MYYALLYVSFSFHLIFILSSIYTLDHFILAYAQLLVFFHFTKFYTHKTLRDYSLKVTRSIPCVEHIY